MVNNIRPRARTAGLLVRELADEALVYDLESHKAICLNRAAHSVWKNCDGRTNIAGLVRRLREESEGPADESVVWLALEQLSRNNLLSERVRRPAELPRMSRRALLRRLGVAAAASLPLITSIIAPTAAEAASCLPSGAACTAPAECCSGLCPGAPNGTCA